MSIIVPSTSNKDGTKYSIIELEPVSLAGVTDAAPNQGRMKTILDIPMKMIKLCKLDKARCTGVD